MKWLVLEPIDFKSDIKNCSEKTGWSLTWMKNLETKLCVIFSLHNKKRLSACVFQGN